MPPVDPTPTHSHSSEPAPPPPSEPKPEASSVSALQSWTGILLAGKYRLAEQLGEGGMGSVWLAHQSEPVKRSVTVKFIKTGMDSKQVLARFEAERQALALMDHPNIAKVLDGGMHEGRPYFVMELVRGVPITEYCDRHRLTPRQRLELFVPVCLAIQHAHQKGIIHRDIKPSNVLVATYDDKPTPKVIDFGVAKATGGMLTEQTLETGLGAVVGTPSYMSPEQATLNNLDIDTRSDVYSLGVLLYELLTGSPPFEQKQLEKRGLLEILRVIREEEAPRPSAKLGSSETLPRVAATRGTEPRTLTGLLQRELDWVVMKALEKERTRRYPTANGLAADVLRFLSGEAVQAHPPSALYRLGKLLTRYRTQSIALALVLLALVFGILGTSWGFLEARRQARHAQQLAEAREQALIEEAQQRALAEQRQREAERQRERAERNLAFARKGNELLGAIFESLNPKKIAESQRPVQDLLRLNLKTAVKGLDEAAIEDPITLAELRRTLSKSLMNLGEYKLAAELLEKSYRTYQKEKGPADRKTLVALNDLAMALGASGELPRAIPLMEDAVSRIKKELPPEDPNLAISLGNLGLMYQHPTINRARQALPLFRRALELNRQYRGPHDPATLNAMNNLATCYLTMRDLDSAMPLLKETLELRRKHLAPGHPDTLLSINNLAIGYREKGDHREALHLAQEALQQRRKKLGPDDPDTLISLNEVATAHAALGEDTLAANLFKEVVEGHARRLGNDHPATLTATLRLIRLQARLGQNEKAQQIIDTFVPLCRTKMGKESSNFDQYLVQMALALLEGGMGKEAEPLLRESLALRQRFQPGEWSTFNAMSMLGGALLLQKKVMEAEPLLVKGYEGMEARQASIPSAASARRVEALDRLIALYTALKKPAEVERYTKLRARHVGATP